MRSEALWAGGAVINAILVFFLLSFLLQNWVRPHARVIWVAVSLLALGQLAQPTLAAVAALLLIQELLVLLFTRIPKTSFLPLIYAATLITLHHWKRLNVPGFSYLVLASSLDLWLRVNGEKLAFKERFLSLISFTKTVVGPIASAKEHRPREVEAGFIAKIALFGILKGFLLVNMWRTYVPAPAWAELQSVTDYAWFGLWQYVHLYLEFSGICDLVAAAFWLYGFGAPLNFDRPYMALTVTEFWKRWHITLGLWIKNFVFIPLGGSRVGEARLYLNLILAMFISGAWHGLTPNFLSWGLLQGVLLCVERAIGLEKRLMNAGQAAKVASWAVTQILVTASWVLFFARI
jgi:alginate O-acetyltransferase complex protein AlgI